MLRKVVGPVVCPFIPEDFEVVLDKSVLQPPESHIPRFGFLVAHFLLHKSFCDLVISLKRGRRLGVTHLFKEKADRQRSLGVVKNAVGFRFSSTGHNSPNGSALRQDGAIGGNGFGDFRMVTKKVVASDATSCLGEDEVGSIGVDVEAHVAGIKANNGIGVARNIIKELVHFLVGGDGGLGLLSGHFI